MNKIVLVERELAEAQKLLKKNSFDSHLIKNRIIPMPRYETGSSVDLYVFYLRDNAFYLTLKKIIERIKDKVPETKVMISGPIANQYPWQILFDTKADFVCIGENDEETILTLCQNFGNEFVYSSTTGLGYKRENFGREEIWLGNKREPKGLNKRND